MCHLAYLHTPLQLYYSITPTLSVLYWFIMSPGLMLCFSRTCRSPARYMSLEPFFCFHWYFSDINLFTQNSCWLSKYHHPCFKSMRVFHYHNIGWYITVEHVAQAIEMLGLRERRYCCWLAGARLIIPTWFFFGAPIDPHHNQHN